MVKLQGIVEINWKNGATDVSAIRDVCDFFSSTPTTTYVSTLSVWRYTKNIGTYSQLLHGRPVSIMVTVFAGNDGQTNAGRVFFRSYFVGRSMHVAVDPNRHMPITSVAHVQKDAVLV